MKGAARTTERDVNERTALSRERSELAKDRTRLANKRTFLAWCRTALAFMTFGFLLEKIDSFILSQHLSVPDAVLSRLGALGMLAFMGGPVVMFFAGWRYYLLEKKLGFDKSELFILPEMLIFGVITLGAIVFVFY